MWREPTLYDARLHAMTNELAGCEQSGWTGPHDQDRGNKCSLTNLAERQRHEFLNQIKSAYPLTIVRA
jgi:hypothetical protein